MASPVGITVEVTYLGDVVIVEPRGELDLATIEALRAALDGISQGRSLLLDLRGLSFIDSTGLHFLTELNERAKRDGVQLRLIAPPAPIDRVIRLSGLDRVLPFVSDIHGIAA